MAFREPMGFAATGLRRRATTKVSKTGKARRRVAVVGGARRSNPAKGGPTKKTKKETGAMAAKRKSRKGRKWGSPAQRAALKKMQAARRKSNPTRSTPKKKASKRIGVKKYKSGATSVTARTGMKASKNLTKPAANLRAKAISHTRTGVRRTYKKYKNGKYGVIIRENPANRAKAVMGAAAGFGFGILAADVLDRYVATRKTDGADAQAKIAAKADGTRIFAQAAGTGVCAAGAYMARKSVVGSYLLGGVALAFAAKAVGMIFKDHLMPALLKTDKADGLGKRLGYVSGPRGGYMGAPRPFQGKPAVIGPQATGSVGAYGCTRVPVSPSSYYDQSDRESCKPWPFAKSPSDECLDEVSQSHQGQGMVPFAPPNAGATYQRPSVPTPVPSIPRTPPGGTVVNPEGSALRPSPIVRQPGMQVTPVRPGATPVQRLRKPVFNVQSRLQPVIYGSRDMVK